MFGVVRPVSLAPLCASPRLRIGLSTALCYCLIPLLMLLALGETPLAAEQFDHFSTGFELDGVHTSVSCADCHVGGVFVGTDPICASCHSRSATVNATAKPVEHIATNGDCSNCHTTSGFQAIAFVDHVSIAGSCAGCHDGVTATGKTPTHILSSDTCDDCHTTAAWTPALFDHSGVTGNCGSCHDGVSATGKGPAHIATTNVCEDCHNTLVWMPADTVDHTQVLGTCSSCHDGATAPGKNSGHFTTSRDCGDCHESTVWIPHTFIHSTLPYEPLDHRANLQCMACHETNSQVVTWTQPAYQPDCAGCHAVSFKSGSHRKHENPDVNYTASELRDCSGACHMYTDSSLTTIKESRPGPEHRISDGNF